MANILRMEGLEGKIGLKKSAIWDKLNPRSPRYDTSFPRPISLGPRAKGFIEAEVDEWLQAQASRRSALGGTR